MKVKVNPGSVVDTGKKVHKPGGTLEINEKEAKRLIGKGVVLAVDKKENSKGGGSENPEVSAALKAVAQGYKTGDGKPTVDALKTLLGREITADERDSIWAKAEAK